MVKKIIFILTTIIVLFIGCTNIITVKACDDIIENADSFVQSGKSSTDTLNGTELQNVSGILYNVLLTIGVAAAVITGAILGIQFMTGSVEQKAKVKDSLIPFVVGCVIIFGAFGIWKLVITIMNKV